jgi:hypothetical protein
MKGMPRPWEDKNLFFDINTFGFSEINDSESKIVSLLKSVVVYSESKRSYFNDTNLHQIALLEEYYVLLKYIFKYKC